jgi:hypothetical protein
MGIKNGKAGIHICRWMAYPAKRFVILTQILQFLLKYQFSTLTPWGWGKSVEKWY